MRVKELIAYLQDLCNERPETAEALVVLSKINPANQSHIEVEVDAFEYADTTEGPILILPS